MTSSKKQVLVSFNKKGFENGEFFAVLRELQENYPLVTLINPDEVNENNLQESAFWLVAGGDGTLNQAVNVLMKVPQAHRIPLCYLPSGTGNDFARTMGLDGATPTELVKDALGLKKFRLLSVGRCNSHYFINVATGGLFATVTPEANAQLKETLGRWSYFLHGISKVVERETFSMNIDQGPKTEVLGFFVGNARYVGGGIQVAPGANPYDTKLDFLAIPEMPTPELLSLGVNLQKEDADLSQFPIIQKKIEELTLSFEKEVPINLDGEQIKLTEAKFTIHPKAVEVYTPDEKS